MSVPVGIILQRYTVTQLYSLSVSVVIILQRYKLYSFIQSECVCFHNSAALYSYRALYSLSVSVVIILQRYTVIQLYTVRVCLLS